MIWDGWMLETKRYNDIYTIGEDGTGKSKKKLPSQELPTWQADHYTTEDLH